MNCDLCKVERAIIFIEHDSGIGGNKRVCLCKKCADLYNIKSDMSLENNQEIIKLFNKVLGLKENDAIDDKKLCSVCGKSLLSIKKTGLAGCSECYATFPNEIQNLLKSFDVDSIYAGSLPKRLRGFRNTLTDRIDIQMKLEDAIAKEDYEKAAVYRDFLKALDKGYVAQGEDSDSGSFTAGELKDEEEKND